MTTITALPTPPSRDDPATFRTRADAFMAALPDFVTETNAVAGEVNSNASTASTAANTATTQAGIATTQAGIATTKAGEASTSASIALGHANTAEAAWDAFDDRYLGSKTSNPTTDNDGNALLTGALYWNSVAREMRVYDGAAWQAAYLPASGYLETSAIGVTVQPYDADTPTVAASQAEMEAGTEAAIRSMSPLRVAQAISALAAGGADYQEFTSTGTWTKPSGAQWVYVEIMGGGGGGGSGRRGATSSVRGGGCGGGGGAYNWACFPASELSSTVTVTVGAGGTGGAAISVDTTSGNSGNAGGTTSFGTHLYAYGGGGGKGGTSSAEAGAGGGGVMSAGTSGSRLGGEPAFPDALNIKPGVHGGAYGQIGDVGVAASFGGASGGGVSSAGVAYAGGGSVCGGSGGGAGGGITSGNAYEQPGAGGVSTAASGGGGIAGVSQNAATAGSTPTTPRAGGGGGGSSSTQAAGAGGNGYRGGGGGGGGASKNGFNSGAGGNGGSGYCRVWSI